MRKREELFEQRRRWRQQHIDDLLSLLYPQLEKPLGECNVLDVGCAFGTLTFPIAKRVKYIKGIDVNKTHIEQAKEKKVEEGVKNIDFEFLSVHDLEEKEAYDVIICSDAIEHVGTRRDQENAMKRMVDALKKGGVIYISTNNRYWPLEGHKRLPFLTYMPRKVANKFCEISGRGDYLEKNYNLMSYFEFKRLLDKFGLEYEFKSPVNPANFAYKLGKRLVEFSDFFWIFANAFQVVGKKTN